MLDIDFAFLPCEGIAGTSAIIDRCANSWTAVGNAKLSTNYSSGGSSSLYLDGAGDYVTSTGVAAKLFNVESAFIFACRFYPTETTKGCLFAVGTSSTKRIEASTNELKLSGTVRGSWTAPTPNVWHTYLLQASSSGYCVFIDRSFVASYAYKYAIGASDTLWLGATWGTSMASPTSFFKGYLDEIQITPQVLKLGAKNLLGDYYPTYNPPVQVEDCVKSVPSIRIVRQIPPTVKLFQVKPCAINMFPHGGSQFGGKGIIRGTVSRKDPIGNTPIVRRVRLLREEDYYPLKETWSDPVTGYYEFTELSLLFTYTVIAVDYERSYRAVVADNLVPEVL